MSLIPYKSYDEIIGLGKYCQLAWYLRSHNLLSKNRFMFDEMGLGKLSYLCDLIENKFDGFLSFSRLKQVEFNKFGNFTITDEENGILSAHDFDRELDRESHQIFLQKKMSEVNNFFESIKNKESVLFVRVNNPFEPLEQSVRLFDALKALRKEKKFDLYIFQEADFVKKITGMPNMFMFYDEQWKWNPELKWHGNIKLWDTIFNHVRIKNKIIYDKTEIYNTGTV